MMSNLARWGDIEPVAGVSWRVWSALQNLLYMARAGHVEIKQRDEGESRYGV